MSLSATDFDAASRVRHRGDFGGLPIGSGQALLVVVGAVAYVAAKGIASAGTADFASGVFLLVGLVPFLVASLLSRRSAELGSGFARIWVVSLVAFVLLSNFYWLEELRLAVRDTLGLQGFAVYATLCTVVSVAVGLLGMLGGRARRLLHGQRSFARVSAIVLGNLALFAALVFMMPASF